MAPPPCNSAARSFGRAASTAWNRGAVRASASWDTTLRVQLWICKAEVTGWIPPFSRHFGCLEPPTTCPYNEENPIVMRQAVGDTPLAFRRKLDGVWTANAFRLFFDLRNDPRRGREQADRLREEVIGF